MALPGLAHLVEIAQTSCVLGLDGALQRVRVGVVLASEGDGGKVECRCGLDHLEGVEAVLEAAGLFRTLA